MKKIVIGAVLALALAACATQYQAKSFTGGFSETQLDQNVWTVAFKGNGYTQMDRAVDFTLLRSAELALDHGYGYFVIVEKGQENSVQAWATPTTTVTNANATAVGNTAYGHATSTTYGGQNIMIRRPETTNTIVCFVERPANAPGMVYDAAFLKQSIRDKYQIK